MENRYNKIKKNIFLVLVLVIINLGNSISAPTTSIPILYYPIGAKINAMGNTYNSLGFDIFSASLNPAVVGIIDRKNMGFTTAFLYESTVLSFLGYILPTLDYGNFAFNILYLNSFAAKETDEYNRFTGKDFSYINLITNFGWGKEFIVRKFYVGGNIKFLLETIDTYNRSFVTTSLGVVYRFSQSIDLAANIGNIFNLKMINTEDILPININIGVGIKPFEKLSLGLDISKSMFKNNLLDKYSFGINWSPYKMFSIRAGKNDTETSFGFGVNLRSMSIDYAAVLQEYLGISHRISLDFKFGKTLDELWAERIKSLPATEELEIIEAKLQTEEEKRKYFQSLFNEAVKNYTTGNYKQALNNLNKAKEIHPEATDIDIYIDRISIITPLYSTIEPTDKVSSLLIRGISYFINGDNVSAVKVISYASSLAPNDTQILRLLTKIEEKTGVRAEKVESAAGATIVDKLHSESLIAFRKRDYARAIKLCEEILLLEPEDVLAYKRLGSAFYALGQKEKAFYMWQQALRLDPKDEKLKSMLENMKK
ncbi:MAG: tetratricopeptide repeat protein [Endomicrobia bacterium]|nr:tetratricopeptide repeat protein [Endomicrobiia bacterium]